MTYCGCYTRCCNTTELEIQYRSQNSATIQRKSGYQIEYRQGYIDNKKKEKKVFKSKFIEKSKIFQEIIAHIIAHGDCKKEDSCYNDIYQRTSQGDQKFFFRRFGRFFHG